MRRALKLTLLGLGTISILLAVWLVPIGPERTGHPPVASAQSGPPPMSTARMNHLAVVLPNGQALLVGGRSQPGGVPVATGEVYDAAQNQIIPLTAGLNVPRAAAGGTATPTTEVLVVAGEDINGRTSDAELFLTANSTFAPIALRLPGPLSYFSLTTLIDRTVLVGGLNGSNLPTGAILLLDPRAQTVTPSRATLATPRGKHASVALPDGRLAILGGVNAAGAPVASIEIYNAATDAVSASPVSLASPRAELGALLRSDGRIQVSGGRGAGGVVRRDTEIVDLSAGTTTPGAPLVSPRAGHQAVLLADGRTLVSGGTDGTRALATLELLAPLADQTPPQVVAVRPADGATDIGLDAQIALRFSKPLRVTSLTAATVTLTGPSGRVEGTVGVADSGLLAFFTPSAPLAVNAVHTIAIAGAVDVSGLALPAWSSRFRTVASAGDPPTVTAFAPTAGAEGDEIRITGTRFIAVTAVRFGGTVAPQYRVVSATEIRGRVPANALTGAISVTTPAGTGTSQGAFVVISRPDYRLVASPPLGETLAGDVYVFALNVQGTGGFIDLVRLAVSGLPGQITTSLDKSQLGPVGYAYLTLRPGSSLPAGQYPFTVTGTSVINGQSVQRTVQATLRVLPPGGTSLSGQLVRLDGTPIQDYTVKIGTRSARTDAGGNFLLRDLTATGDVTIILDGRTAPAPAGFLYPVFEKLLEYEYLLPNRPNRFPHGVSGPMWVPTMETRNGAQVDPTRDTVLRFPNLPGLEIAVPAGTTFRDLDGNPTTTLYAVETPLAQAQAHLQHLPGGMQANALFSLQFGGTTPSRPIQVTVPNRGHLPPGTRTALWFYDPTRGGWFTPGQGTVTDDGQKIVPDPGVAITRLGCLADPGVEDPDVCPGCDHGGEPVALSSGVFVLQKTDLVVPGRLPLVFTRIYRSRGANPGPFGIGTSHSYRMLLASDAPAPTQVILPTNFRLHFINEAGTWVHRATPTYWGAVYTPTGGCGFAVTFKDGTRWAFRVGGHLCWIKDRHGNQLTFEGPDYQPATGMRTPDGRSVLLEYDPAGRISKLTGPLEQTVRYTYTPAGDLATVTDPMGGVTTYTYDGNHNLLTIRDARNILYLTNDYSPSSRRVLRQTQATTPAGTGVWFFRYQLTGATVTGPGCPPTCPDIESWENVQAGYTFTGGTVVATTVVDPRGKTTRYTFNPAGYTTSVTNALSQTIAVTRPDASNLITQIVDPLNRTTLFDYDTNKNVTKITRYKDPPTNQQPVAWQFGYDPTYNLLTSVTTPPSGDPPVLRTWTYGLDAAKKNVTSVTDPPGHQTTISRNSFGQITGITAPPPLTTITTTFLYDPTTGFLTTVTDALNNTTTYAYDQLGRRVRVTDPRGARTRFAYDLLNRVIAVADPLGRAVQFQYDPNSNLTRVIDPRNGEITYAYDNMDRLQTRTDPLTKMETFAFDVGGNLTSFTDRKNQQTMWDAYDDLNRPTVVRFKNAGGVEVANLTYGYDAANRVQTLTDSVAGAITWGYDPLDRLISETTPGNNIVTYVPDDANRRTSMTVSGQPVVTYTWDNADRLMQIARAGLNPAVQGYDNANRRTSLQLPNLVNIGYGYDDANRLTSLTYSGLVGGNQNLTYAYDPTGNRTVMAGSWARTLLPDAIGSASYDAADRQLTLGSKTMTYDDNGNLATLAEGGTTTYTWDVRDRLAGVSAPALTASFTYDASGRRTQKTINAFATTFQYDGVDIVREVAGGAGVSYLRGLRIDEPLARIEDGGSTTCYAPDALGSSAALTDGAGNVATSYTYEPFGRTTTMGAASQNPFQFTGRESDGTGLYYYRSRYYDPGRARFLQEDPLRLGGGRNFYAYVANNPVNLIDPLGLAPLPQCLQDLLQPYFPGHDLGKIDVDDTGVPWEVKGALAYAADERHIYIERGAYDPSSILDLELIIHEVWHTYQHFRILGFPVKYFWEYWTQRMRGVPHFRAYYNNPYEVEARDMASRIFAELVEQYGNPSCPPSLKCLR